MLGVKPLSNVARRVPLRVTAPVAVISPYKWSVETPPTWISSVPVVTKAPLTARVEASLTAVALPSTRLPLLAKSLPVAKSALSASRKVPVLVVNALSGRTSKGPARYPKEDPGPESNRLASLSVKVDGKTSLDPPRATQVPLLSVVPA